MHHLPIPMSLWHTRSRDKREGDDQGDGVVFNCKAYPGRADLILVAVVDVP
jgi:hypothetical protein